MKNKIKKKSFYFKDYNELDFIQSNSDHKKTIRISLNRITFLSFIFFSLIFIFSIKIIYLSLSEQKTFYSKNIKENLLQTRRNIVDRNGNVLATNVILYDVGVRPELLKKSEKKNLLIKLGILFPDLNLENIKKKLNKDDYFSIEKR